jgi:hypothetical protein
MRYQHFLQYCIGSFLIIFLFFSSNVYSQNVGIGTSSPAPSAKLDISSTTGGLLPPRMTTTQRNAIVSPVAGLIIYNITTAQLEIYNGSSWNSMYNALTSTLPVKKLYGTMGFDYIYDIKPTPDGGFIYVGNINSAAGPGTINSGTLIGITNYGLDDAWVVKLDAKGTIEWQKLYGGTGNEEARAIANCTDGGYVITGSSTSSNTGTFTGSMNNGSSDAFVLKLDANGNVQHQKLFGGSLSEVGTDIQQAGDGGFIVASYSFSSNTGSLTGITSNGGTVDGYVIKTDASLNISWQRLTGGTGDDIFNSVVACTDGSFMFTGFSSSSNTGTLLGVSNNGLTDAYIVRLSATGNLIWQKLLGGSGNENAINVIQTADGGFAFAGTATSFGTGTLTGTTNNGSTDGWIVKMDGNGNLQWQKLLGGSSLDNFFHISQLPADGYIVSGHASSSNTGTINLTNNGSIDAWVLRLDATGNTIWQKLYGGSIDESLRHVAVGSDGSILLGTLTSSSNTGFLTGLVNYGGTDIWLLKMDSFGNPL